MKYVIVSKIEAAGTSKSDIADPCGVTEIATELVITRLYALSLLQTFAVDVDDTIVCNPERKCLYTKIFKNVISWDEYKALSTTPGIEVLDLLEPNLFNQLSGGPVDMRLIPYLPFYKNWERDKDLIQNIDFSDLNEYNLTKPFVGLVIRKRAAWSEKNLSDQFWNDIIKMLTDNKINVKVFGKEADTFCINDRVEYVKNFQDWCGVVAHSNCKHVSSTMTGAVYPLLIFGNPECKMTIIDNTNLMARHGNDPSFYHECINFQHIDINFIKHIPTTDHYYYELAKDF